MQPPDLADVTWHTDEVPNQPVVLTAFAGWNDAGDAATSALQHLRTLLAVEPLATVSSENYFDFTTTRPTIALNDNGTRNVEWPDTKLYSAALPGTDRPVVFVEGVEPQLQWRTFASRLTTFASAVDAELVVTVGALLADVPHTRPVEVYGTSDDPAVGDQLGLIASSYEGPTGITGVLASLSRAAGLRSASLWAAVPSYISSASSPKAALALVKRIETILRVEVDTTALANASASYEKQVTALVADDAETREYVIELEADYDEAMEDMASDDLVGEIEHYLRNQPEK